MTQFTATEARALVERLTGYTRGPWSTETDLPYMERPRVYGGDDSLICEAGNCGSSQDEWEANATLIAAAPDLHRHLTAALDEIERLRDENNRFRGALGDIHDGEPEWPDDHKRELAWCRERARSALKGADQ